MCGIITNQGCKTYAIYCNPDHTHILVGMHPVMSPSKLMEHVKSGSSKWINEKIYIQEGFHGKMDLGLLHMVNHKLIP